VEEKEKEEEKGGGAGRTRHYASWVGKESKAGCIERVLVQKIPTGTWLLPKRDSTMGGQQFYGRTTIARSGLICKKSPIESGLF